MLPNDRMKDSTVRNKSMLTVFCGSLVLISCSSNIISSGVNQIGPDTYTVSVRAGRAQGGVIGAEGIAMEEAGDYCRNRSREILVLTDGAARGAYRVTFRCLLAGDPELRRQQ